MLAPSSLSMNRLVRLKELVRVNEDNKVLISCSFNFLANCQEIARDPKRL